MRPENFTARRLMLAGWSIGVSSYRLAGRYYATVESLDSGVRIARADADTREEAERIAVDKARERLGRTRTFPSG